MFNFYCLKWDNKTQRHRNTERQYSCGSSKIGSEFLEGRGLEDTWLAQKTRIFQLFCSRNGWKLTGTKNTESWKQETPKYCENETLNPDVPRCDKERLKLSALNKPADLREEESRVVFTGAYPLSLASPSKTLKRPVVNFLSFKNLSWFFWESLVERTKIQLTVGFVPQNGGCCKVWRRSQSGRNQSDIIVKNTKKNTKH